jgi:galactonate dehydratase
MFERFVDQDPARRHSEAVEGALKALSKWFIGWPTDNMNDIYEHAYRGKFYRGGEVLMSALSGLDIALWDLKGKRLGVPVWSLLGGLVRDTVRCYSWIGGDRPGDVLEQAKIRKEKGFTAVKVRTRRSANTSTGADSLIRAYR